MALSSKNRQLVTVIAILGVVFGGFIAYYYFYFAKDRIKTDNEKAAAAQKKIDTFKSEKANLTRLINDKELQNKIRQQAEAAVRRLPKSSEDREFLQILRDTSRRTGITTSRLAPGTPVARTLYTEVPYQVTGAARYHEFGQFLNLIECNPDRLMRVSRFKLSNNTRRPSIHPMEVGVTTYTFGK